MWTKEEINSHFSHKNIWRFKNMCVPLPAEFKKLIKPITV